MATKSSILLEADPGDLKIFRSTVRRWTVPT
jgi:hypothetical protein